MKRKLLATMGLVVASMMVFAGCGAGNSTAGGNEKLMVIGSTSVEPLMQKFIDTYTTADVEMQAPGSSQGIAAAQDGTADIGMSSRELKDSETGLDATAIAYDGIVAVVNPNCPVNDLTKDQLAKIFKGEIKNWKEVGGPDKAIAVFYREAGSGTRGAFIELTGVEEKTADGKKVDNTTADAEIANKTDVVLTSVAGNEKAIGYISLGALNNTVKAVKVDGAEATVDNVKAGAYKLSRPFNIATKGEPTGVAKDFISFILSKEGQAVVTDNKYIAVNDEAESFVSDGSSGQIAVGGSSSVSPVMEKLIEAYKSVNPNASIDLQTSDSTSGMTGAMDGTFAIGMASRELKDEEAAQLTGTAIALDGIAVIVNPANTIDELSMDQIKSIYVGDITDWGDLA